MVKKIPEAPYPRQVVEHLLGALHADVSRAELILSGEHFINEELLREQVRLIKAVQNFVRERPIA